MHFKFRRDARKWFSKIENAFDLDFDMYYLCLMAGLAACRKADAAGSEVTDLIDHFPSDYRPRARVILALFVSRELRSMGISLSERSHLHSAIQILVDPRTATFLSDVGMREFNRYCHGGFEEVMEWFDSNEPRNIETFLPRYRQKLSIAMGST